MSKKIVIDMLVNHDHTSIHKPKQKCRICGCDDLHACKGGCYWVEDDICSQCAEKMNSCTIKIRKVTMDEDEVITDASEDVIIAEELPNRDMAEGFIFGYAAGKENLVCLEDALDHDPIRKEFIGISIWIADEPIVEYFFDEVKS